MITCRFNRGAEKNKVPDAYKACMKSIVANTLHQTVDALGFSGGLAPYAVGALYTIPAIVLTAKPTSRYTLMDPQETLRNSYIATETEDNFPFYMEHTSDSARPIARHRFSRTVFA